MASLGLLLLRAVTGFFLMGHGAQKLFGAFGGRRRHEAPSHCSPSSTSDKENLGVEIRLWWFFLLVIPRSLVPARQAGKLDVPLFSQGGAELPATNLTIACALILTGPGAFSLDRLLRIRVPWWLSLLAMAATAGGIAIALADEIHKMAEEAVADANQESAEPREVPAAT